MTPPPPDQTTLIWRSRLAAALRTYVACILVGCATLYGPSLLRHYPAFSYVTAILIVSPEATLASTLQGMLHALVGTVLVAGPAMGSLWFIGPGRFTPDLAAIAVAVVAFGVAAAESVPILAKRIAVGQMVVVYVGAVVLGAETRVVMHPCHVAASTTVGALASVLAMLLPFPRMASYVVKKKIKSYGENASWRLKLFISAIADDYISNDATDPLPLIKSSSLQASKLLKCIEHYQDAMFWEVPKLWLSSAQDFKYPAERLQELEMSFKGMEMALASHLSRHTNNTMCQHLKDELLRSADQLNSRINQHIIRDSSPEPNADDEIHEKTPLGNNICTNFHDLPVLFFLQSMNLLNEGGRQKKAVPDHGSGFGQKGVKRILCGLIPRASNQSLLFAFKCSLSLGLAVLLGLTYTKQNGYWSGLTIAISFVRNRQATFSTTNARAQGTALGTAYGVLGYFFCRKFELLKLVSLLPWIVFTTFLRHSKMYGEAGSISAAVAALLILGRRDYGTPTDFAIARLIESFIGLSCFILVEILVKPERAVTLVKARVSDSFRNLKLLLEEIVAQTDGAKSSSSSCLVEEKKRAMKIQVDELNRLVEEAREEPDFWFKAFQDECYTSLLESAKRIADALFFMAYSVEELTLELKKPETEWKGYRDQINVHIELFKRVASASFLRVAEEMGSNQYNAGDRKQQLKPGLIDNETGVPASHIRRFSITGINEEEARIILDSFLHHAQGLIECRKEMENPELKKLILLRFGSLAFCMQILVADTTEVGRLIEELNLRENL